MCLCDMKYQLHVSLPMNINDCKMCCVCLKMKSHMSEHTCVSRSVSHGQMRARVPKAIVVQRE